MLRLIEFSLEYRGWVDTEKRIAIYPATVPLDVAQQSIKDKYESRSPKARVTFLASSETDSHEINLGCNHDSRN